MRGAFITNRHMETIQILESGVYKKINAQMKCLSTEFKMELWARPHRKTFMEQVLSRFPFTKIDFIFKYQDLFPKYDFVYIRMSLCDDALIRFLRKLKHNKPTCKIILEYPTYPYDQAMNNCFYRKPLLWKDKVCRKQLHKYVDRVATFSLDKFIFCIPTIPMVNGIDYENLPVRTIINQRNEIINIVAVASMQEVHGYDRFLQGMGEYYRRKGTRKIIFHCVGNGPMLTYYQDIVKENELGDSVIFYGLKTGNELNQIYNACDLAIETLAWHRDGVKVSSTLKSREYLAKGLPFVSEAEFPAPMNEVQQYILKVAYDESPVDIEQVIAFYDRIYHDGDKIKEEVNKRLRTFAKKHFDMRVTMQPVIDYIKSGM